MSGSALSREAKFIVFHRYISPLNMVVSGSLDLAPFIYRPISLTSIFLPLGKPSNPKAHVVIQAAGQEQPSQGPRCSRELQPRARNF